MKISYLPYELNLKHEFNISYYSRNTTPVVLVRIEHEGYTGYGEASLPQYLNETQESIVFFLKSIMPVVKCCNNIEELIYIVNVYEPDNLPAKAAVNIALNDLKGKISKQPVYKIFGINQSILPYTSFTIGLDNKNLLKKKIKEAEEYKILKVKLGKGNDKEIIETIREVTDKPLFIDVNQGWNDKYYALDILEWMKDQNVLIAEQPFPKENYNDTFWLKDRSPIPIIADEAFQTLADIDKIKDLYTGINIKLMKCGGVNNALSILRKAKEYNLKIMLGCMTETSCAVSAAINLAGLIDYADLDGNLLITNDPFTSDTIEEGRLKLPLLPGLGIKLIEGINFIEL
jgi:L-alanine-DL-glutamate epimerase-like enolase superfamily enzyme